MELVAVLLLVIGVPMLIVGPLLYFGHLEDQGKKKQADEQAAHQKFLQSAAGIRQQFREKTLLRNRTSRQLDYEIEELRARFIELNQRDEFDFDESVIAGDMESADVDGVDAIDPAMFDDV